MPPPLSLAEAVHRATSGTAVVAVAEARADASRARVTETRGALLPSLSAGGLWLNRSFNLKTFGLQFPTLPGQAPLPDLVAPFTSVDGRITATWNVFDYSSVLRLKAAGAGVLTSDADRDAASEGAAAMAGMAYVRAARGRAAVQAREDDAALSRELVGLAQSQVEAGVSAAIDVTRAQTQLAQAEGALLVARNEAERAQIDLARAMGADPAMRYALTDTLASTLAMSSAPTERTAAIQAALRQRPDLNAEIQRASRAALDRSAVGAERLPKLGLAADWGYSGLNVSDAIATRQVAVQVTVPLLDGFRREGRIAEADAAERESDARRRDLEQQVAADVGTALLDIESAGQQEAVAARRVALAQDELAQARDRFQTGVAGNIEVIDAQSSLVRARDAVLDARTQAATARIRLARAVGSAATLH
ncbi:MAG TPA: TolC family protein [Gemmatimonadales bacterium]|jgi:outer membrane protein TolC